MIKKIKSWLVDYLGGKIRLVEMSEAKEKRILKQLGQIEELDRFLELQKQRGYQMYSKSNDAMWLGYVTFADTLQLAIDQAKIPEEKEEKESAGYQSSV